MWGPCDSGRPSRANDIKGQSAGCFPTWPRGHRHGGTIPSGDEGPSSAQGPPRASGLPVGELPCGHTSAARGGPGPSRQSPRRLGRRPGSLSAPPALQAVSVGAGAQEGRSAPRGRTPGPPVSCSSGNLVRHSFSKAPVPPCWPWDPVPLGAVPGGEAAAGSPAQGLESKC